MKLLPRARRLLLFSLVFVAVAAASCSKTAHGPAMWHLSDADSDIYLFGTFHLLSPKLDWQRPAMLNAFDKSSILILEADVNGATPGDVVNLIKKYGVAPPDKPLSSRLTAAEEAQFEKVAKSVDLDPKLLDGYEPWYAATVLTVKYATARGLSASEGAEETLIRDAETQNKPTAYLETVEQQIQFLANLPETMQNEMFIATIEELGDSDAMLADMQKAWVSGNTRQMAKLFDKSVKQIPDLYEHLIVDRNEHWADEIAKLMDGSGKAFIAVGAGHLVGKDSVIALLRKRGYKVEGP